jgi:GTP-binding protein
MTETVEHEGAAFEVVDTGGMGVADPDGLSEEIERQIHTGLERADVVIFVVDARDGLLPDDSRIADRVREMAKPVVLVANKVESRADEAAVGEFFRLGLGEPLMVSALEGRGRRDLVDAIVAAFPPGLAGTAAAVDMKLAIVGRRNVGKSTLVNAIAGEERVIVSELPGTTRDAVDVRFEKDGKTFVAIDTAGVRKRGRIRSSIEFYSFVRATQSIARADVVLLLLDATSDVVEMDKRLAREIAERLKPCVIVVNKWDLAKGRITTGEYADYLDQRLPLLDYAPVTFITAKTGRRVMPTIELAQQLFKQARERAPTALVNQELARAVRERSPRPQGGRIAKFYYATQVAVAPPTIVAFANDPALVSAPYRRYLANALRRELPFPEIPIRIHIRPRTRSAPK